MRAATPRKQAMRTLFHAGRYLRKSYPAVSPDGLSAKEAQACIALGWAINIIANAYNQVLGV